MELKPVSPTAKAPSPNFTGDVYVNQLKTPDEPSRLIVGYVRFTPGARANWHFHALGQTLHCTDGIGLVATRDGSVIQTRPGDTVWTPPGEEHGSRGLTADDVQDVFRRSWRTWLAAECSGVLPPATARRRARLRPHQAGPPATRIAGHRMTL